MPREDWSYVPTSLEATRHRERAQDSSSREHGPPTPGSWTAQLQNRDNKPLLFKPLSTWFFVTEAPAKTLHICRVPVIYVLADGLRGENGLLWLGSVSQHRCKSPPCLRGSQGGEWCSDHQDGAWHSPSSLRSQKEALLLLMAPAEGPRVYITCPRIHR